MTAQTPPVRIVKLMLAVALLGAPDVSLAEPVRDGLVLWLDAEDASTVSRDAGEAVVQWADRSGQGNDARQTAPNSQPQYE